ncbi:TetR/AcrR family transcriptional regulator [Edaphobacter bradus]|uniref:TetR/AcrR family transcriptional regulator n=1 Tax=Edaphobacter bradus TaxID=2259016 RepID=UPI0021E0C46F|nr:TetR/AcrR family transcriptional regulator [Edaphobacter bradus]
MAHRTISDDEFLDKALDLFRTYGFHGVSLSMLAEATGLEKASLYYRFPGGKDEIAMAVVSGVTAGLQEKVFEPLKGEGSPRKRISIITENLRGFYSDGTKACVIEVLSIPGGSEQMIATVKAAMQAWIKSFTEIARESGLAPALARSRAEEAVLRIEGSLVLSRVLGDNGHFQRSLKLLPELLTVS